MKRCGLIFCLLASLAPRAWAEPYLAAWKGVNCNACHVNETGGWLRNDFGKNYGAQLATFDWVGLSEAIHSADRAVPPVLTVGLDIHESYVATFSPKPVNNVNGFTSGPGFGSYPNGGRQALEIGVKANKDLMGVMTYRLDDQAPKEVYAIFTDLPEGGYLKFGKFTRPYGLELADDNSLIRGPLGFGFDSPSGEGVEGGIFPDPVFVNFAFFNGDPATSQKAFSGKGGFSGKGWALAGSLFGQNLDLATKSLRYGGYGWGNLGPAVLLAEYDRGTDGVSPTSQDDLQAYHVSAEVDLGFACYLRLATEWLWDSMGIDPSSGYRHLVGFRCYPAHNLKFQLDLVRQVPANSSGLVAAGSLNDMVVADGFFFY